MREGAVHTAEPCRGALAAWLYAAYLALPRGRFNRARDLRVVHRTLLAGRAGELARRAGDRAPPMRVAGSELTRTVNRVRDLLRRVSEERPAAPARTLDGSAMLPAPMGELSPAAG